MSSPRRPGAAAAATTAAATDTLAAAQARVAARRTAALASQRSQQEARSTARAYSDHIERLLPAVLQAPARRGFDGWDVLRARSGTRPAFRVGQADAELLDEELLELLRGQVREGLKGFSGWMQHHHHDYTAEISLALRLILFKLSIWDHNASYGATLQGLKYVDARSRGTTLKSPTAWQKTAYGLLTVGGRYVWQKWEDWLLGQDVGYSEPSPSVRRLSRLTNLLTSAHSFATLLSFLAFLINGRYRTLVDRLLRMRLAPPANQISREVSFEYLNRQLVWHAFPEFLLFLLPLVGIGRWRRWLARAWHRTKILIKRSTSDPDADADEGEDGEGAGGELGFLPERTCAICYQDQNPTSSSEQEILAATGAMAAAGGGGGVIGSAQTDITNPYETVPCGHVYCYYCLVSRLEAEEGEPWMCLRCGELCTKCRPWKGDVIEEPMGASRLSKSKSVHFETTATASASASITAIATADSNVPGADFGAPSTAESAAETGAEEIQDYDDPPAPS